MKLLTTLFTLASTITFLTAKPIPTILSTDIGSDIDDTWALAHILRSPELDLKMVLTETGEALYRGQVTGKVLEATQRADVSIALGKDYGVMGEQHRHQGPWVKNYDLSAYPGTVHQDGVQAFINLVKTTEGPINIIAIGPPPSLAAALKQAPEIAEKCHFYGMHGSFDLGYGGSESISAETNVRVDPGAFRAVMSANWLSNTLTPLDTCGLYSLEDDNYQKIWSSTDDPLLRSVIENYCVWAPRVPWMECDFFTTRSSTLFDDIAVYMAYDGSLLNYEDITFSVTDDGYTLRDPQGPFTAKVAISWKDKEAFQDLHIQRLLKQ
ncbi:nucleoside hydrolase [Pelagicoccus sp. SDUM812002]|uniref:nucleoside hydrolase n=1 Tax=Pelagicoccus sp. SDUM812002 TaxID=3041266 RepID=UPI00280F7E75|nr:nucleoside hydrolase [Pelagicoccus sp. SDUM812002]MDQ8186244.1 nucleoside hydrolase [Pelagicoccus sp. SDUM812002]